MVGEFTKKVLSTHRLHTLSTIINYQINYKDYQMREFFKLLLVVALTSLFIACENNSNSSNGFSKQGKAGSLDVTFSSTKSLTVGENSIDIMVTKDGEPVRGARVEMKIFMPEMPGMPYMESIKLMKPNGNIYSGNINISMGGTWQVRIFIEKDGKKYKLSSSIII